MTTRHKEPGPLARKLTSLRGRACLTREKLAERSGVSADLVQSLEQGRAVNPTLRTLLGIARALGLTISELVEGVEAEQSEYW